MLRYFIILNGFFDLFSALLLTDNISSNFKFMITHQDMIISEIDKTLLAFWIATYGIIRIYAGITADYFLAFLTYLIETIGFFYKSNTSNLLDIERTNFVIGFSLLCATISLIAIR